MQATITKCLLQMCSMYWFQGKYHENAAETYYTVKVISETVVLVIVVQRSNFTRVFVKAWSLQEYLTLSLADSEDSLWSHLNRLSHTTTCSIHRCKGSFVFCGPSCTVEGPQRSWYSSTVDASSSWSTHWPNCKGPYAKWILLIPHLFRCATGLHTVPTPFMLRC